VRALEELKLFVAATNAKTVKVFEGPELTADHVMASACPALFVSGSTLDTNSIVRIRVVVGILFRVRQSYRKWRREYGARWEAAFRQKYEREMIESFDTHFLLAIYTNIRMLGSLWGCSIRHGRSWAIYLIEMVRTQGGPMRGRVGARHGQ
jgi:hypothetical protein